MDDDEFYQLVSFIRLSPYRRKIIKDFHETGGPKTPKDLAKVTDINLTHVSHHLIKLKEHELVTVINPNAPRHRYYRLTVKGRKFVKQLEEIGFFND